MKTIPPKLRFIVTSVFAVMLLALSPLRAQLVNDSATRTLSNVTTNITGDVTVGTNGPFTLLVLSDNALLTNSAIGVIGRNANAKSNEVRLISATAGWLMGSALHAGSSGSFNRLTVSNGAVVADVDGFLGLDPGSSNNVAVVTGAGSLWTHSSGLLVGYQGGRNQLLVGNGGVVACDNGHLGYFASANNNVALVTGAGSMWSNRLDLNVGLDGAGNQLVVSNSGTVLADNVFVGFSSLSANNRVTVDGGTVRANVLDVRRGTNVLNAGLIDVDRLVLTNAQGVFEFKGGRLITQEARVNNGADMVIGPVGAGPAVWDVRPGVFHHVIASSVVVGNFSPGNQLLVTGGALLTNNLGGFVGFGAGANANAASISGANSRWRVEGDLVVGGGGGAFNRLTVSDAGWVVVSSGRLGANTAASSDNFALVTGAGSVWSNAASVIVGEVAPGNQLLVSAGGAMFAANGVIGQSASASANTVSVSDAGSQWRMEGNLEVGRDGSFNDLVVSDGALVSDFDGIVGNGATASNNMALVTGAGSLWSNASSISVGLFGAGNQLVVSNGGAITAPFAEVGAGSDNNQAVVADSGSVWSNGDNLNVGASGRANRLTVRNGGLLVNGFGAIGVSSSSNEVIVTGASSLWSNRLDQSVGFIGLRNQLIVSDGGTAFTGGNSMIGDTSAASSNTVIVTGSGSRWLVRTNLFVGNQGAFNRLVITNGGLVSDLNGFLGVHPTASNNTALVTGPGSLWSNSSNLEVGLLSEGNQLVVSNGGSVVSVEAVIGDSFSSENNLAVVTGPGSAWSNSVLFVGQNGGANRLVVSNAGRVVNDFSIMSSRSNQVLVTGAGSLLSNRFDFCVGDVGSANRLLITNSGTVSGSNVVVGCQPSSTNNRVVVDGGTFRATPATGTGVLDVRRGTNVLNAGLVDVDQLVLTNKGTILSSVFGNGSSNNIPQGNRAASYPSTIAVAGLAGVISRVTVTLSNLTHPEPLGLHMLLVGPGGQKVMLMSGTGGFSPISNVRLTFDDTAAAFLPSSSPIVTGTYRPTHNFPAHVMPDPAPAGPYSTNLSTLLLSNPNGVWSLFIDNDFSGGNLRGWSVAIETDAPFPDSGAFEVNGGTLVTRGAVIDNRVPFVVGGPGGVPAVWEVRSGASDHFVVSDLIVGSLPAASSNNLLHVTGGTLNAGTLDIRGGTNRLDAGLVDVDRLVITNTSGQFELNGGSLRTPDTTVANGRVFTVGGGASAATLQFLGGTHAFANNLVVASNGSLIGNGVIDGTVTVSTGGRLIPGAPIGRISVLGTVILQGAVNLQIDKSGGVRTNDQVTATGAIFYSGALNVTDIGSDALTAGDRFQLFNAAPYVSGFTTITLPPLDPGLVWLNKLAVDGSIEVIATPSPRFGSIILSGAKVVITGSNGAPDTAYHVLASTNLARPLSNWVSIATNQFDGSGRFVFTNVITPAIPRRFFQLRLP